MQKWLTHIGPATLVAAFALGGAPQTATAAVEPPAVFLATVEATPEAALLADVPLSPSGIPSALPCSPLAELVPLPPVVVEMAVGPVAVTPQDEEQEDEWDVVVACEGAFKSSVKFSDGKIHVQICTDEEPVACAITKDGAVVEITLNGCMTVSYEPTPN